MIPTYLAIGLIFAVIGHIWATRHNKNGGEWYIDSFDMIAQFTIICISWPLFALYLIIGIILAIISRE